MSENQAALGEREEPARRTAAGFASLRIGAGTRHRIDQEGRMIFK